MTRIIMPKLACKKLTFYSKEDENSFFKWLDSISCIKEIKGIGDTIFLTVNTKKPSNSCLREILAIFQRYKIDMTQLAVFLNDKNKEWFYDQKQAYWHKKVFKKKK